MSVRLTPVREAGGALLARLHREAFAQGWAEAEFARLLALPHVFGSIAYAPAPDGFVLAWAPSGDAEILTLAVRPAARRRGLARTLVMDALAAARAVGAPAMLLDVAADNDAALALYEAAGFHEVARRAAYYARGGSASDALVLRRALS